MIPLRTGNLSVDAIRAATLGEASPPRDAERAHFAAWRSAGFDEVEDYVAWSVAEPARGEWDWSLYRANAEAAKAAGLRYVVYAWAHAVPDWFRESDEFVPATCLEHSEQSPAPSLYAPATWKAVARFYLALREGLGDLIDGFVAAFPNDYGEVGYGSGMADWLLVKDPESAHHHAGYWCGEKDAHTRFAAGLRERYATNPMAVADLWQMDLMDAAECPFPTESSSPEHWADFAHFYRGTLTWWTAQLLALAQQIFPDVPRELKLGHASEALNLGADYNALVREAARRDTTVRSTHSGTRELFTKRIASLCRSHGARFATEAPRELELEALAQRVFTDAANGSVAAFEFPEQFEAVREHLQAAAEAYGKRPARNAVALYWPNVDLDLEPGRGLSENLGLCYDSFRRTVDFDLLDADQIAAGALEGLSVLVWLEGLSLPAQSLEALEDWVRAGGALIVGSAHGPKTLADLTPAEPFDLSEEFHAADAPLSYRSGEGGSASGGCRLDPGDEAHRLWLGEGWFGREDGGYAWPEVGAPVVARWSSARAELRLPRIPDVELELVLDAFSRGDAPVRVTADGNELANVAWSGSRTERVRIPASAEPVVTLAIETEPLPADDVAERRELGLLIRSIHLAATGVTEDEAPSPNGTVGLAIADESLKTAAVPFGAGCVLQGDGTPLSALAWLQTWLENRVEGCPAPQLARDLSGHLLVTELEGGLLLFHPGGEVARAPRLPQAVLEAGGWGEIAPLEPLETRWLPRTR